MGLSPFIHGPQFGGDSLRVDIDFRNNNNFRSARYPCHQGQVAAFSTHDFNQEGTVMRGGGNFQPVYSFQRYVQSCIDSNGYVRAVQVVIYG